MDVASIAATIVAGQQSEIRNGIAMAVAKQQVEAQQDFVAQVAELARQIQAAPPAGTGKVVDTRA